MWLTEAEGHASAVLIRAVEPVLNITKSTRGPGLLCKAMQIDRSLNAHDLLSDNLFVAHSDDEKKITIVKKETHWGGVCEALGASVVAVLCEG